MSHIVDSHCHLDFPELQSEFSDVLERAKLNNVFIMQTICTRMSNFPKVLEIAENNDQIYASVGVHPNEVEKEPIVSTKELVNASTHEKVIGIGETGLDYYYDNSARELQIESFRNHIDASRDSGLPIIIHTRNAEDDTIEILQNEMKKGKFPGLIHCFTSDKKLADAAIEMGLYISLSGIVTFKNAQDLRMAIRDIPLNRVLIETDSPYLAPVPKRGKSNEPSFVKYVAEFLADFYEQDYESFANLTTENFLRLFSKVKV